MYMHICHHGLLLLLLCVFHLLLLLLLLPLLLLLLPLLLLRLLLLLLRLLRLLLLQLQMILLARGIWISQNQARTLPKCTADLLLLTRATTGSCKFAMMVLQRYCIVFCGCDEASIATFAPLLCAWWRPAPSCESQSINKSVHFVEL
jgi:hypothetical protein